MKKTLEMILSKSVRFGVILSLVALIAGFIMRYHFLFSFVPRQVKYSGGFWDYLTGAGDYGWYLSDPVGLLLFLWCLIPASIGLCLIFGGAYLHEFVEDRQCGDKTESKGNGQYPQQKR